MRVSQRALRERNVDLQQLAKDCEEATLKYVPRMSDFALWFCMPALLPRACMHVPGALEAA